MVMGCGNISSYSWRIKVNTRSSTETELVSVDAYMPEILWSLYFIQAQGYGVKYAEIHQDNMSEKMLETNGTFSSSRRTKHIKAKCFFIKERVAIKEVEIADFPAGVKWANLLTKPLQGTEFRKMRAQLVTCAMEYKDKEESAMKKR